MISLSDVLLAQLAGGPVRRFLLYALFGGLSTLVDLGVFEALWAGLGLHHALATVGGTTAGAATNYLFQKYITFQETSRPHRRQLLAYTLIVAASIGLSVLLMIALVDGLGLWPPLAWVLKTGIMLFANYGAHAAITFNNRLWQDSEPAQPPT